MAKFSISSTKQNSFSIIGHSHTITSLVYEKKLSNNATIWLDEKTAYTFIPKGLWNSAIELKQNNNLVLSIIMNWKGELIIDALFNGELQMFIFKSTSKLNKEFGLYKKDNTIIAMILPDFEWDKFSHHYHIETTETFDEIPSAIVMLYTLVYCTNFCMYKMYSPSL